MTDFADTSHTKDMPENSIKFAYGDTTTVMKEGKT